MKRWVLIGICFVCRDIYSQTKYMSYHLGIIKAEQSIIDNKLELALYQYDSIFKSHKFIFLKDLKVATQIAALQHDSDLTIRYLHQAIAKGWSPSQIKRNKLLKPWFQSIASNTLDSLQEALNQRKQNPLRSIIRSMYQKDQKMAFRALLRIGQRSKTRFAEKRFAPHSHDQVTSLIAFIKEYSYPGEYLIGNDYWASTILSHHNSISPEFNRKDTLYQVVRELLYQALEAGQISPHEIALIEDWRNATLRNRQKSFAFLDHRIPESELSQIDTNRSKIGLRKIVHHNDLIDTASILGINLYLMDYSWTKDKFNVQVKF